ncbi:MAG: lipoate--protein ligase [Bacteroidales bacterium]|nr:lipoate--protein ligase [Bacteroidales bacterium]HOI31757.1 lipoate--protein ligase [Bacteroidales bacterium]
MFFLDNTSQDPWFNLAAEEYLLRQTDMNVFMLWENAPCLVIGKHQNPVMEINASCLIENTIPFVRRISGGGTVFHGPGNLNFSFITTSSDQEDKINFQRFTKPILDYLKIKGIPAEMTGKSNLTVNGLKISGNAAHVFKNRSIHHGTLLFDADLEAVNRCLRKVDPDIQTKAVQSIRANVTTLKPYFRDFITYDTFKEELKEFICNDFKIKEEIKLNKIQRNEIQKLVINKYKTVDWNFGYSPSYQLNRKLNLYGNEIKISVSVNKGLISTVTIENLNNNSFMQELKEKLVGKPHNPEAVQKLIKEIFDESTLELIQSKSILYQLF